MSKNVDEYIALAPKEALAKATELRSLIKSAIPEAEERISYGMVGYYHKGPVVYFGIWKKHIGLYALPATMEEFKGQLKGFVASKGTIQFPFNQKLPVALIKKMIKMNMEKNKSKK